MAGPDNQRNQSLIIPAGESEISYTSRALTQKIINFEFTVKRTLATMLGPTIYEPERPPVADPALGFGKMHGIFHTLLLGGQADTLLVRSGTKLYQHTGWTRGWEEIYSGLTSDTRAGTYPDQFVVINDKIVWTNGINRPLIIDAHGAVHPLGFDSAPSAPQVLGPTTGGTTGRYYPNANGYSWRGDIGTPGDALSGVDGAILDGAWYYYVLLEDLYGNLSAPSSASAAAWIRAVQASAYAGSAEVTSGATLDDLTRQFALRTTATGPDHTVAVNVYRTPDTRRASTIPRFLVRLSGRDLCVFGDRAADSDLGPAMPQTVSVPTFRVMCVHQGRLVIGNTPQDPGIVRRSQPGFPGTFEQLDYIYPDSTSAEVTALVSHMGRLLAFSERGVYDISDFANPTTLSLGIGCAAPRSIQALPDGTLVWLSRDGFYGYDVRGRISRISDDIHKQLFYDMNTSRYRRAVAALDPISREYHCAIAPAGEPDNKIIFCYDGQNWRRHDFNGITIDDICTTDDYRQLVLFAGQDGVRTNPQGQTVPYYNVFVKDHETTNYTPPARKALYRSGWYFGDQTGSVPLHVRSIYLGMVDAFNEKFTIRFFRNNSWKPVLEMTDVLAVGVDDDSQVVADIAGSAVVGTAKAHEPRLFWRMVPVGLENAYSWAFEIEVNYPTRINIAAISIDQSVATGGNVRGRFPLRADV